MKQFDDNIYFNTHVHVLSPQIDASLLSAHFTTVYLNNIHEQTHTLLFKYIEIQPIFF